jgi:sugar lactone lactonase YvrE
VTVLSNGNYVVASPAWNDEGAATLVNGSSGLTFDDAGSITTENSLVGDSPNAGLSSVVEDTVNHTFLADFTSSGSNGTVKVGLTSQVAYALERGQNMAVTADFLTMTLDTGTAVVLQASNDITLNDPITVSAGGHGGSLTLQAGRSILLDASITTDNGNLTLIANDTLANGVLDADRAPGAAVITMAAGTSIDAGTGSVTIDLRDGAGKSSSNSGAITLQSISAGALSISNEGPTDGSDIDLAGPINAGTGNVRLTAASGNIQATSIAAEIATTGTVMLDATGNIGSPAGRLALDAIRTPASVVAGTTYQASSVYLDGRGSLTLGSIWGGTANTTVDVTARDNLTVAANATIDSGAGTIRLGADLSADGQGEDGAGTLSIASGAEVRSDKAITLRGADMDIQGTVHSAATLGAFNPFFSGVSVPYGLALDAAGNLYVADAGNGTVSKVPAGGGTPSLYASGLNFPVALALDAAGNLYVANNQDGTVSEVPAGGGTPTTYASGPHSPFGLALDAAGNLYVADQGDSTVREVPAGGGTPTLYASGLNSPAAMAFDAAGNLYVANASNGTVSQVPAGGGTPTTYASGLNVPYALACDTDGTLFVADVSDGTLVEVPAGGKAPLIVASGLGNPVGLAFDRAGNLYLGDYGSGSVRKAIAAPGSVTIQSSLEDRPMSIGGSDSATDGINLTDAELAHIITTSGGTITFGDASQTGDLIFATARTATTAGASTIVLQATDGTGAIVLDEQFRGKAINGNGGSISLTAGTSGTHVINQARNVHELVTAIAPANQTAVEGVSTAFSLGAFTDIGTTDGPWTVTVNWGDKTTSTFGEDGAGTIDPQSHVYAAGTYTATVAVATAFGVTSNTSSFQVVVSDPAVTIGSVPGFLAVEGFATGLEEVGRFIDPGNPAGLIHSVSAYSVNVDWGDGAHSVLSSPANIAYMGTDAGGNGIFSVLASHAYAAGGLYDVQMSVTDGSSPVIGPVQTTTATILEPAVALNAQPLAFSTGEGQLLAMQPVATFTDPIGAELANGRPDPNAYSASIDWGDQSGSDSNTTIQWNAATQTFTVLGSHRYAEESVTPYAISVTLKHGSSVSALTALASVADQPISDLGVTAPGNVVEGVATPASFNIAAFTDPAGGEAVSDYTASIDWGDGTQPVAGTVVSDGGGSFHVSAPAHTYADEAAGGTLSVSVQHDKLPTVSATAPLTVADLAPTVLLSRPVSSTPPKGLKVSFNVSATQVLASENAAGYSYSIDFGDGSRAMTIKRTTGNGSGVAFTHTFPRAGVYTVTATATDVNGAVSAPVTLTVSLTRASSAAGRAAGPPVPVPTVSFVNGVLTVKGVSGISETIQFQPAGAHGVEVFIDGVDRGSYGGAGGKALSRIIAIGAAQNETITVDPAILVPAELYGGPLNDTLSAGGGPTIEVGGAGNNVLTGGSGRDILVGGAGSGTLDGMGGDDVLIAGTVLPQAGFAQRQKTLEQALATWTSSAPYSIRSPRVSRQLASLIRSHAGTDELTGGEGTDLFFANLTLPDGDQVSDLQAGETILDLKGKMH